MSALNDKIDFNYIKEKVNNTKDQHFINNYNNNIKNIELE